MGKHSEGNKPIHLPVQRSGQIKGAKRSVMGFATDNGKSAKVVVVRKGARKHGK